MVLTGRSGIPAAKRQVIAAGMPLLQVHPDAPAKCRQREGLFLRQSGFTLLELMVVIFIISMTAAIVLPRLPEPEEGRLKNSARNLASGLRFLNDQAIVTKKTYRLHLDLGKESTRITQLSPTGDELQPGDQFMGRRLIEEGIEIEDVTVPRLGLVTEGEVLVSFGPGGLSEGMTVHLKGGERQFTVIAYPSGGKVRVLEGYREEGS